MGGVVVDDGVDRLARGNLLLDDIEEANKLLMAMAMHVAAHYVPSRTFIAASSVVVPCRT